MERPESLARALLNDPQLLVLNDPTSGLDLAGRRTAQFTGRVIIIDHVAVPGSPLTELPDRGRRVAIHVDRFSGERETTLSDRRASKGSGTKRNRDCARRSSVSRTSCSRSTGP
jgi:hypothetical protein